MRFGPQLVGPGELRLELQRVPVKLPRGLPRPGERDDPRRRRRGRLRGGRRDRPHAGVLHGRVRPAQAVARPPRLAARRCAPSSRSPERMPLSVRIRFDDPLRIRNKQAQLDITGALSASGTLAQPVTTGQVTLLEGGQVTVRRARDPRDAGTHRAERLPLGRARARHPPAPRSVGGVADQPAGAADRVDDLQLTLDSPEPARTSRRPTSSRSSSPAAPPQAAASAGRRGRGRGARARPSAAPCRRASGDTLLIDVSSDQLAARSTTPTPRSGSTSATRLAAGPGRACTRPHLDGTEQRWVVEWNPRGGRFRLRRSTTAPRGSRPS